MATGLQRPTIDAAFENAALDKSFRRIIPFLFLLCFFAQLDRSNIGFAALAMNKDLGLTTTMFAFATATFYIGYACFEIPSNMMLARFGARIWLARILIVWGLVSAATLFAVGPRSLYLLRLLLGVAEAGFLPGVFLYLTFWFPPTYRARATALFLIAQGVTMAIASPISGLIMQYGNGGLGLSGWRWLFLIEGVPSSILGIITLFYLSDRPSAAKWLTAAESSAIEGRLQREQGPLTAPRKVWREVLSPRVIILALMYFGLVFGLNTALTWTPLIVRDVVKARNFSFIGVLTSIPAICAVIFMIIWSAHSDRKMERIRHYAMPLILAAFGWLCVSFLTRPEARMLGLICAVVGVLGAQPIFWSIPPRVLPPKARPVGIAFISSCGMVAGATSGMVLGFFRDLTHTWVASLMFVTAMLLLSAFLVFLMPPEQAAAPERIQAQQTPG